MQDIDQIVRAAKSQRTSYEWRHLLKTIIDADEEKQRIATALGIHPQTLMRWAIGASTPRLSALRQLVALNPQQKQELNRLIVKEFPNFKPEEIHASKEMANETIKLPTDLYMQVLQLRAEHSLQTRVWSIGNIILEHLLSAFDAYGADMVVGIALCNPPTTGAPIRSLRRILGRRRISGQKSIDSQLFLSGSESVIGHALMMGRVVSAQHFDEGMYPACRIEHMKSAVSCPIQSAGRLAGAIAMTCLTPDFFQPAHLKLIAAYANLLAVAFSEELFYEPAHIQLAMLPAFNVQKPVLDTFHERLKQIRKEAIEQHLSLSFEQVEQKAWQQIEAQLLAV